MSRPSLACAPEGIDKLTKCGVGYGSDVQLILSASSVPLEIVAYAVWLYYRFALSSRNVEELLPSKGLIVSYEAVRLWCGKFCSEFARSLRPHRRTLGRRWFVDELFIRINGTIQYLWRAVDNNGVVVNVLVQAKRDRAAAE